MQLFSVNESRRENACSCSTSTHGLMTIAFRQDLPKSDKTLRYKVAVKPLSLIICALTGHYLCIPY